MKKYLCLICLCLLTFLCFIGCNPNPQIVKGGPLVREDFNFYQNGQVTQNPDVEEDGWTYLGFDEATARGIQIGATRAEVELLYPTFPSDPVSDASGMITLTNDVYSITFFFDDEDILYLASCSSAAYNLKLYFHTELSILAITLDSGVDTSTLLGLEPWLTRLTPKQREVLFRSAHIIKENDDSDNIAKLPYLDALTPEEQEVLKSVMEIYEQVGDFPE